METQTGYFKTKFAEFQANYDEQSYISHRARKEKLYKEVDGDVLEIGPGTGVNFKFLEGKKISWTGIEPNPAMHDYLLKAAQESNINANLKDCVTENICIPTNSMDFVISSEVLCSVNNVQKSLQEIKRVLKPGGKFLFLEHVVDKKNVIRRTVQKAVPYTPWACYSDGCHPARDLGKEMEKAGFSEVDFEEYMQEGQGIILNINRPHIVGYAKK